MRKGDAWGRRAGGERGRRAKGKKEKARLGMYFEEAGERETSQNIRELKIAHASLLFFPLLSMLYSCCCFCWYCSSSRHSITIHHSDLHLSTFHHAYLFPFILFVNYLPAATSSSSLLYLSPASAARRHSAFLSAAGPRTA